MNEDIVQHKIKLIGFRASRFTYDITPNPEKSESHIKKFNIDLEDLLYPDSPNFFAKIFKIELNVESPEKDEIFNFLLEYQAIFECASSVTDDFLNTDFAKISAPAIGFPYVRAFLSTFSVQAGLPPLVLPSINFVQFNKEQEKLKKN